MSAKEKTVTKLDSNYMHKYDAYIDRQKRRKQRLVRRLVLFSTIVLLAVGSMISYNVKQRILQTEKMEQYDELEAQIATLEKEENNYQEEVALLNNDEYVLEIARTNYFFSKKGEMIFKIFDERPSY